MSLIQEVAAIRSRPTTDAEKLTKARALRHRLAERLQVALIRLGEIQTLRWPEPAKTVTDELKAALIAHVTELVAELKSDRKPASDTADDLEKHLRGIREEFQLALSKASRSDIPYEKDRSAAADKVLEIVSREISTARAAWAVDIASHSEECFERRETEVRRLLQAGRS